MKILIHDEAETELHAAADWYEQEREGLGFDFMAEAYRVINVIAKTPTTWPFVLDSKEVRRLLFNRFPYAIYYALREDHILIMAIGHTSRKPGYWQHRLNP